VGTSQYLSPEQASGQRRISDASDQYALGVVMYECVTQRTPQQGEAMYSLLRNVAEGRRVPLRKLRADLPPGLEAIIERAMGVRPKDRFVSAYELGRALFPFASAEGQRQFDDYYRASPEPERPSRSQPERKRVDTPARPNVADTVEQAEKPPAPWSQRETRTSSPRDRVRRSSTDLASEPERPSRKLFYSVAIGAVLAVVALGALGFALRP
jgi:serine/threonine protein kinase